MVQLRAVSCPVGQAHSGGIENLDLDIREGEFLGIVGPAGCGKTALVRILAGLDRPSGGAITMGGHASGWGVPALGFMPAESSLFPWLTVRQNLWLPLRVGGFQVADPWRVDALLGLLGLLEMANHRPAELPLPTRRLIELCRALVRDPALVLLDEPFRGLGFDDRIALADQLERVWGLCRKAFVLFTQDIAMAVRLADRVMVLAGRPARIVAGRDVGLPRPRRAGLPQEQTAIVEQLAGPYEAGKRAA